MKTLFINNKRVTIDTDNTYFPFSYKVNDLENVNIISMPVSKTVEIPRNDNNDEIFGYIGELNHIAISGQNNKVSISFNQTKKATYELYNDSELVSSGLVVIEDIDETKYSVTLYDELIDKMEELSTINLNQLDLFKTDNSIFNVKSTAVNINSMITGNTTDIVPLVCNKKFDLDNKILKCYNKTDIAGAIPTNVDLPVECSSLQLKCFKNYEFNYGIPLNRIIKSINETSNENYDNTDYPTIIVDNKLTDIFNEVHLISNTPTNPDSIQTFSMDASYEVAGNILNLNPQENGVDIITENGEYYLEIPITITYTTTPLYSDTEMSYARTKAGVVVTYPSSPDGQYAGDLYIKTNISAESTTYKSKDVYSLIPLIKGTNMFFHKTQDGYLDKVTIRATILVNVNYYPGFITNFIDSLVNLEIVYTNPNDSNQHIKFFGDVGGVTTATTFKINESVGEYNVKLTKTDFRTGDYLNAYSLLPKVSIKDFLINIVKYFNLSIEIIDGNIYLNKKKYYQTDELLIIDGNPEINVNLIQYSKLILKYNVSGNDILDDYEKQTNKVYGEQIINTGYSVKETESEVTFDISIPFLYKDVNNFAYDRYTRYFGGGYNKVNIGDITEFDDKITLAYLNKVTDQFDITDDTTWELEYVDSNNDVVEEKFVHFNPYIRYDAASSDITKEYYRSTLFAENTDKVRTVQSYYTASPYKFDSTGKYILKSLELNKPEFNYANITDTYYRDTVTHYSNYYKRMTNDKFNVNTHTIKCSVYLDGKVDIYKIYNYQNNHYIISEITEYDPTSPGLYEVTFMRVNDVDNYTSDLVEGLPIITSDPSLSGSYLENIEITTAIIGGTVISTGLGDGEEIERGIVISEDIPDYYNGIRVVDSGTGLGQFSINVTGLTNRTYYWWRAYAKNRFGIVYGDVINTHTNGLASPTTLQPGSVGSTSARLGVSFMSQNGNFWTGKNQDYDVTEYGICYSTNPNPTTNDSKRYLTGQPLQIYASNTWTVTGLSPSTKYYVRGYCINGAGVAYGSELTFTTSA